MKRKLSKKAKLGDFTKHCCNMNEGFHMKSFEKNNFNKEKSRKK